MDAPATIVKNAIQPATIVKFAVGSLVVFALLDLMGATDYLLRPVSMIRARMNRPTSP